VGTNRRVAAGAEEAVLLADIQRPNAPRFDDLRIVPDDHQPSSPAKKVLQPRLLACSNVVVRDTGVVPRDVDFSPTLTQQAYYEIYSQPAASDNRLSSQHRCIEGYVVSPTHRISLSAIQRDSEELLSGTTAWIELVVSACVGEFAHGQIVFFPSGSSGAEPLVVGSGWRDQRL
jgi:hypothetical protein